ncbi:MAG: 50S ribosomal protein L24 [Planctomycetes bacterium GWF2_50_10]|nr:MAG: 50S ribosomal protein L24 [Planctomycetes bacterium GWF2_50_10]
MAAHVKKGDLVQIIAGSSKGATGKVLKVIPEKDMVVIEGHNRKWKHVKQSRKYPQGGRLQVERPVHISNVLPVNPKSNKGSRVRFEADAKGGKKRVTLDGTELGVVVKK